MGQSAIAATHSGLDELRHEQDEIARLLVDTEAVNLATERKFRFGSGLPSPIYIDNRRLLSLLVPRKKVCEALYRRATRDLPELNVNVVVAVPTGGLPWAAWLADDMDVPLAYVRQERKDRGLGKQIEGVLPRDASALVVDDLITTGQSSQVAIDALRAAGAEIPAVASIFSYGVPWAARHFGSQGIRHVAVTDLDAILRVGEERFAAAQCAAVRAWREEVLLSYEPAAR